MVLSGWRKNSKEIYDQVNHVAATQLENAEEPAFVLVNYFCFWLLFDNIGLILGIIFFFNIIFCWCLKQDLVDASM